MFIVQYHKGEIIIELEDVPNLSTLLELLVTTILSLMIYKITVLNNKLTANYNELAEENNKLVEKTINLTTQIQKDQELFELKKSANIINTDISFALLDIQKLYVSFLNEHIPKPSHIEFSDNYKEHIANINKYYGIHITFRINYFYRLFKLADKCIVDGENDALIDSFKLEFESIVGEKELQYFEIIKRTSLKQLESNWDKLVNFKTVDLKSSYESVFKTLEEIRDANHLDDLLNEVKHNG
ncbi:MAG: hypothetical protein JJT76_03075 [Clostridiaceae bacterium]|nr:hypothetical protein [Clostridiaceae bacterium]